MRPNKDQLKAIEAHTYRKRRVARLNDFGGAEQSHRDSTDLRTIIDRYQANGQMPALNGSTPLYGDFSQAVDLHTQLNRTRTAQEHFDALPSAVRAACDNDPVLFLEMFNDQEGRDELRAAGIDLPYAEGIDPAPEPEPTPQVPNGNVLPNEAQPAEPGLPEAGGNSESST